MIIRLVVLVMFFALFNPSVSSKSRIEVENFDENCLVESSKTILDYRDKLKKYNKLLERISVYFSGKNDINDLFIESLKYSLSKIDPHATLYTEEEYKQFKDDMETFQGIGVIIEPVANDMGVKVLDVLPNYPASQVGIKVNDIITKIDDKIIKNILDLRQSILEKNNKSMNISILRNNKVINYDIIAKSIKKITVHVSSIEDKYLFIKIKSFNNDVGQQLHDKLSDFLNKNKNKNFDGIIFDLRDNLGGLINSAIDVAEKIMEPGIVTKIKNNFFYHTYYSVEQPILDPKYWDSKPVVVLVNSRTASAAEILAGALKDRKNAIIVGNPTIGKGTVQSVLKIDDLHLKITTARYFTPNNHELQLIGIIPDFWINNNPDTDILSNQDTLSSSNFDEINQPNFIKNSLLSEEEIKKLRKYNLTLKLDSYISAAVNILDFLTKSKSSING